MAVTMDYQAWTSSLYNWLDKTTATSAPLQINDKLDAWVASVNANASNASKQITVERDPSNSTSANFVGWVIKLASPNAGSTFYASLYSNATTAATASFHAGWTASTTNGSYGTQTNPTSTTTGVAWYTSGQNAEFAVATETQDGQEFFCLGWKVGTNTSYSGTFLLFKDTGGEWAGLAYVANSPFGTFWLPTHSTPTRQYGVGLVTIAADLGLTLDPLILKVASTTYYPAAGNSVTLSVTPASPNLLASNLGSVGFSFGRYCTLPGPTTGVCMGYSPIFVRY